MNVERFLKRKAQDHINSLRSWLNLRFSGKRVSFKVFKKEMASRTPFSNNQLGSQIWDMLVPRLYYYLLGRKIIKRPLSESFGIWWRHFWRIG